MFGILAVTWKFSAGRETWAHKPEPWETHPSRLYVCILCETIPVDDPRCLTLTVNDVTRWARQLIDWDKEDRLKAENETKGSSS